MIRNVEVCGLDVPIYQGILYLHNCYIIEIKFQRDTSQDELGSTIWDSALVLSKYLENIEEFPYPDYWKNKNIIELGAGTGVVSVALSVLASGIGGFHITITDRITLLDLITRNCKDNNIPSSKVSVKELDWTEDLGEEIRNKAPYDLILLSDVVAKTYASSFEGLVKTIDALSDTNTRILLAYELRDRAELEFFELLKQRNFVYQKVPISKLDSKYNAEEIGIFEIKKAE